MHPSGPRPPSRPERGPRGRHLPVARPAAALVVAAEGEPLLLLVRQVPSDLPPGLLATVLDPDVAALGRHVQAHLSLASVKALEEALFE